METYQAQQIFRSLKKGGMFMIQSTQVFTDFKLTGQEVIDLLTYLRNTMWEQKDEEPSGGLMGALIDLYGKGEPPSPVLDRILSDVLYYANTRSGICAVMDEVRHLIQNEGKTDLSKPWRECMIQIFQDCYKTIQSEKTAMQDLKTTLRGVGDPAVTEEPSPEIDEEQE